MDLREIKSFELKKGEVRHPWELARLEVILDIFRRNSLDATPTTILDIGCGDTYFMEKFSEYFPTVDFIGIDIAFDSEMIRNYEMRLINKRIRLFDSLDKARSAINSEVSAVFLFDVVEHIDEDLLFLKNISTQPFMTDKTRLFITVPAFQVLFTSHDVFLGHYRRYTNRSLKKLVNQAGFQELERGYFFLSLLFVRMLQLLKEKISGPPDQPTTDVAEWKGSNFKSRVLKSILILDYKFTLILRKTGIKAIGLSNYIVCKKFA